MSSSNLQPRRSTLALLLLLVLGAPSALGGRAPLVSSPAPFSPAGKVLLNREEALSLAFGKAQVERSTVYLDEAQRKQIAKLAKVEFASSVVYPYRATKDGKWIGTAYFDTHRVRSLRETLMVVVGPESKIARVEVLSFAEPKEYLPRGAFYEQFKDRKLDEDLNLKRKIRGVTGATLTSKATTLCARRVLALHQHLEARRRAEEKKRLEEQERKRRAARKQKKGAGTSS